MKEALKSRDRETRGPGDTEKVFPLLFRPRAYTIIEVMVAAGILVVGMAAAAALALTMVSQEEANARVARAFNMQEQAVRLFQLGLDPAEVMALLPPEDNVVLSFDVGTTNVAGVGTVERAECEMVFDAGTPLASSASPVSRTNTVVVIRPTIR